MMQDGKALQAGTSHYLGTNFAEAQNIRFQDKDGGVSLAHTTSWGVTTRLIGGMIMTHGDDDGMRTPPTVAPQQIVIVPMLRGKPEDAELHAYCGGAAAGAGGAERVRRADARACRSEGRASRRQALGLGAPRRTAHLRNRSARRSQRAGELPQAQCAA